MPVMIPGSAIGSTTAKDSASRPHQRPRWTAKAAKVPSTTAIEVASSPARIESHSAARTSALAQVCGNHCRLKPGIGQLCTFEALKA